jgi:hypothetical protein
MPESPTTTVEKPSFSIIDKAFHEWTDGLDPLAQRISVFEHIRDIPYKLITKLYDPDHALVGLIDGNAGSCTPKHFLLGHMFERLGLEVRYVSSPFNWDSPAVNYPPKMRGIAKLLPPEYHLSCLVKLEGEWKLVDATWDLPLEKGGLSVNHSWDGISETLNAVTPLERIEHDSIAGRNAFTLEQRGTWSEETLQLRDRFFGQFNDWVASFRE